MLTPPGLIHLTAGVSLLLAQPALAADPVQPNVPMQATMASHSWHDYDGDGDVDLLVSGLPAPASWGESVYDEYPVRIVLYDIQDGTLTASGVRFRGGWATDPDTNERIEGEGYGLLFARADWADFDGDGDDDILLFGRRLDYLDYATPPYFVVYRNDGGEFGLIEPVNLPYYSSDFPPDSPVIEWDPATWGDVDGDGVFEVAYGQEIATFDGSNFVFDGSGLSGAPGGWIQLHDVDADGDADALVEVDSVATIYRNDAFSFIPTGIELAGGPRRWADWDQDGDPDFLAERDGTFWRNDESSFSNFGSVGYPVWSAHFDDFDGDGRSDVILTGGARLADSETRLLFCAADAFESGFVLPPWIRAHASMGQLDRDTCPDILYHGPQGPTVYHNDGNGGIRSVPVAPPVLGGVIRWIDFDGDGDLDASDGGNRLLRNDDGSLVEIDPGLEGASTGDALWRDFDNDNDLDVVVLPTDGSTGPVQLFWNNDGMFSPGPVFADAATDAMAAAADWNNDGWIDITTAGAAWINRQGAFEVDVAGPLALGNFGQDSWADYDLDGDMDFLSGSYVQFPGESYPSYAGGSIQRNDGGPGWSRVNPRTLYRGFGWVDFNQDGRPDIWSGSYEIHLYENAPEGFGDPVAGLPEPAAGFSNAPLLNLVWSDHEGDGDLDAVVFGGIIPWDYPGDIDRGPDVARIFTWLQQADGSFVSSARSGRGGIGAIHTQAWDDVIHGEGSGVAADTDHDGDRDIYLSGHTPFGAPGVWEEWNTWMTENKRPNPNTRPTEPSDLAVEVVGDRVRFTWSAASDLETPDEALTYNLRVGTTPGGSELMSAMADPGSGKRWLEEPGNTGSLTAWTLDLQTPEFYWAVQAIDGEFAGGPFAVYDHLVVKIEGDHDPPGVPGHTGLVSITPNPFNPRATVSFSVAEKQRVEVVVFDLRGRRIAELYSGLLEPGEVSRTWDGRSQDGVPVAGGTYLVRFASESRVESRKITLLK